MHSYNQKLILKEGKAALIKSVENGYEVFFFAAINNGHWNYVPTETGVLPTHQDWDNLQASRNLKPDFATTAEENRRIRLIAYFLRKFKYFGLSKAQVENLKKTSQRSGIQIEKFIQRKQKTLQLQQRQQYA